ncbi:MAG TPA: TIGR02281 family clan AA aspartic protease [Caulobacteraceae bacterium]|jgi:aspartyl protease family protein|nr:TIGR02281 family clan AA aspartic protease [Caulobacteraceae bacterium]
MLKHIAILTAAVLCAVGAAKGVVMVNAQYGQERAAAQAAAASAPASEAAAVVEHHASTAEVAKAADGHYWAEAEVNGREVRFLVDTGATEVALTGDDARRLGIDLSSLTFDRNVTTASGPTKAAAVDLDYVSVAGAREDHVSALVLESGLSTSLLGMTYLGRLSKFEASRDALILRP